MSVIAFAAILVALSGVEWSATTPQMGEQTQWFLYSVPIILVCSIIAWMLHFRKIRPGLIDVAGMLFLGWYLISYCLNGSIAVSKLLEVSLLVVLYVALRILFASYRNIGIWLFAVLCVGGIVEAVIGIEQIFGARYSNHPLFRATGTFFNPGPYGGYLAVVGALATGFIASRFRYAERVFGRFRQLRNIRLRHVLPALIYVTAIAAIVTITIVLPSTMSRAAFVAVATAIAAIVLSDRRVYSPIVGYIRRRRIRALAIGIASVVVACGSAYGLYLLKKDSADGRLLMWKVAAKAMIQHPVVGVGPGYYRGSFGDAQAEYFRAEQRSPTEVEVAGAPEYGFNEYLQIGAETGVIGLLLFLFLVAAALWRLFKAGSYYAPGLLALSVFAFFSYPFSILPLEMMFVLFLSAAGSCCPKRTSASIVQRVIAGTALAGCVCGVVWATKPYAQRIEATQEWQTMRQWYTMEFYNYVLEDYPPLFELLKNNPTFLFEYGRSLHMKGHYRESLDVLIPATRLSGDPMYYNVIGNNHKALGEYDKAAENYLKAYHVIPHRIYPLYLLGKMYSEIGDEQLARQYARQVVATKPKVESPATRDMQEEMRQLID